MRKIKALTTALLATTLALLGPATSAQAYDNGDDDAVCDTGEICLRYGPASSFDVNGVYSRTFYWSNRDHRNEYWAWTVTPNNPVGSTHRIVDDANGFWNRDTECNVKLWDITSAGTWYVYGDYPRGFRGDVGAKRNNGHTRCSEF